VRKALAAGQEAHRGSSTARGTTPPRTSRSARHRLRLALLRRSELHLGPRHPHRDDQPRRGRDGAQRFRRNVLSVLHACDVTLEDTFRFDKESSSPRWSSQGRRCRWRWVAPSHDLFAFRNRRNPFRACVSQLFEPGQIGFSAGPYEGRARGLQKTWKKTPHEQVSNTRGRGNIYLNGAGFDFLGGAAPKPGSSRWSPPRAPPTRWERTPDSPTGWSWRPTTRRWSPRSPSPAALAAFDIGADGSLSNRRV